MNGDDNNFSVVAVGGGGGGGDDDESTLLLSSKQRVGGGGGDLVVDALPYIDAEYDEPGMKEMVTDLIESEKRRYRPTRNYLDHLPPLDLHTFETPLLSREWERHLSRTPMEVLSMRRYELPPPPGGKLTDLAAWGECVDNSVAQLEHQAVRIDNLALMVEYGAEAWKSYLSVIQKMVADAQVQTNNVRKSIQETNWSRKSSQLGAGEELHRLESNWVGLVSKNYEIERACIELENNVKELHVQRARNEANSVDNNFDVLPPTPVAAVAAADSASAGEDGSAA